MPSTTPARGRPSRRVRCAAALAGLLVSALAVPALGAVPPTAAGPTAAEPTGGVAGAATTALRVLDGLEVRPERAVVPYDREAFRHWVDADGDGCDTRAEVLERDSPLPVVRTASCTVLSGSWLSWYDVRTWTAASDVDVDHVVALAEAWSSGADTWSPAHRQAFANDLGVELTLQVVTDEVNSAKGSEDPAGWLPPDASATCRYAVGWVLVKHRWRLAVDADEAAVLGQALLACGDPEVQVPPVVLDEVGPFPDVPATHPFRTEIAWLAGSGVATGYADGTFGPARPVSRQAFAAYLYRFSHEGRDAPGCASAWFPDVPAGSGFCGEITWLAGTGLTTGYTDGTFRPTAPISRQAMATLLHRYRLAAEASTATTCDPTLFLDSSTGPFCAAITWLAATGTTTGYADGTFRPTAPVSRQATAAYLYRYDGLFDPTVPPVVVVRPPPPPPPPPPPVVPPNPGDVVNCTDFPTWAQARDWFLRYAPHHGDVAGLDADGDGIPCEGLPGAP